MSIEVQHRFLLPENAPIYFYKTFSRKEDALPQSDLERGLIHYGGSLSDVVSLAYSMGYKKMVLVGVDLYDRRYFWTKDGETRKEDLWRNASKDDTHNTAKPIISLMKKWNEHFKENGIELFVYNPKSLLNEVLSVYKTES